jgi:phage terminase small subunit
MKKLTAKQNQFVREYIIDFNATQAAIRTGYSHKTAGSIGSENLQKPEIKQAIRAALNNLADLVLIEASVIVKALMQEAFSTAEDSTSSSRVSALDKLAKIAGLYDSQMVTESLEKTIASISRENSKSRISLLPKDNINFEEIENDY